MQIPMAMPHLSCCAPSVKQLADRRETLQRSLADFVNASKGKAGTLGRHQTGVVRLYGVGQRRGNPVIKPPFDLQMEIGNMARELVHQRYAQSAGLGEGTEQGRLLEAPHDHDPIDRRTIACEADFSVRHAAEGLDSKIKARRRAAVQSELGFANAPAVLRGREVEVRYFTARLSL